MKYPRAASLEQRQEQNPEKKVTEDPAFGKAEEEGRDAQK